MNRLMPLFQPDTAFVNWKEKKDIYDWNWGMFEYRIAEEKPEPLELWVNVYRDESGSAAWKTKRTAEDAARETDLDRVAVHVREVETVEPLQLNMWHRIVCDMELRLFPETGQLLIRDNEENQTVAFLEEHIPALVTALQGLMEGGQ